MPKPKLSQEVVDTAVELLLGGWTPQQVVEFWAAEAIIAPGAQFPSIGAIQRIAREASLSAPRGGPRVNSGGVRHGAGRPRGSGKKFSPYREEVRRLRSEGHSLRVIAGLVGLRSPQQVANLLLDEGSGIK